MTSSLLAVNRLYVYYIDIHTYIHIALPERYGIHTIAPEYFADVNLWFTAFLYFDWNHPRSLFRMNDNPCRQIMFNLDSDNICQVCTYVLPNRQLATESRNSCTRCSFISVPFSYYLGKSALYPVAVDLFLLLRNKFSCALYTVCT